MACAHSDRPNDTIPIANHRGGFESPSYHMRLEPLSPKTYVKHKKKKKTIDHRQNNRNTTQYLGMNRNLLLRRHTFGHLLMKRWSDCTFYYISPEIHRLMSPAASGCYPLLQHNSIIQSVLLSAQSKFWYFNLIFSLEI